MKLDLDERIANAFEAELSSEDLASLLEETIAADEEAQRSFDAAKDRALNPATRPDAVAQARKDMEDAQFRRERMGIAASKIEELVKEAQGREAAEAKSQEYKAAKAERDQLAEDLKAYPELARKLVSLLDRLQRSDKRIAAANVGQTGAAWLRSAEVLARSLPDTWMAHNASSNARTLVQCKIIAFEPTGPNSYGHSWPPPSQY